VDRPDKTVELRPVVVGRATPEETVIAQGLEGDETVVTDGQLRLVPGAAIQVKDSPAAAAQGGTGP
jgi:membrane fusion protein, multidrug efflux system